MEKEKLYRLLQDEQLLRNVDADELTSCLDAYPFFQTIRLLYTKRLALDESPDFQEELGRTALLCAKREKLFYYLYGEEYEQYMQQQLPDELGDDDRTERLLNNFLESIASSTQADDAELLEKETTGNILSVDYFAYLESKGEEMNDSATTESELKHQDIIDSFLEKAADKSISIKDKFPKTTSEEEHKEQEDNELSQDEFLTETLARIYIKQKKYKQALTIIQRLNLNFPKKSAYFADQIRFLEYLIINEQKKK